MALSAKPHEFVIDDGPEPITRIDRAAVSRVGSRRSRLCGGPLFVVLALAAVTVSVRFAIPIGGPSERAAAAPPVVAERAEGAPTHRPVHQRGASNAARSPRPPREGLARAARRPTPSSNSGGRAPTLPAVDPPAAAASPPPVSVSPSSAAPARSGAPPAASRPAAAAPSGPGEFF